MAEAEIPCPAASFLNWSSQAGKFPVLRQAAGAAAISPLPSTSNTAAATPASASRFGKMCVIIDRSPSWPASISGKKKATPPRRLPYIVALKKKREHTDGRPAMARDRYLLPHLSRSFLSGNDQAGSAVGESWKAPAIG